MLQAICYDHFGADPYFNMAFDEWLLERVTSDPSSIFLRLYTWSQGTITFGANQHRETALDFERAGDTPVIRRITGGRALYHDLSEFTYSIAWNRKCEATPALSGPPSIAYRTIASGLVAFLASMGREATYARHSSPGNARPEVFHREPCFGSHARHEVVSGTQKIIASAARQYGTAVLQHGSIKLHGVGTHPALPGLDLATSRELPRCEQDTFQTAVRLLRRTMGRTLGVTFAVDSTNFASDARYQRLFELAKRNPLERRLIFERK